MYIAAALARVSLDTLVQIFVRFLATSFHTLVSKLRIVMARK